MSGVIDRRSFNKNKFSIDNSTGQIEAVFNSTVGTDHHTTLKPGYLCRAWVNFNGTGTVAIRASGNVSSITDNGTGDYTVNFTEAMPDADYCALGSARFESGNSPTTDIGFSDLYSTTQCRVGARNSVGGIIDAFRVNLGVFR